LFAFPSAPFKSPGGLFKCFIPQKTIGVNLPDQRLSLQVCPSNLRQQTGQQETIKPTITVISKILSKKIKYFHLF